MYRTRSTAACLPQYLMLDHSTALALMHAAYFAFATAHTLLLNTLFIRALQLLSGSFSPLGYEPN